MSEWEWLVTGEKAKSQNIPTYIDTSASCTYLSECQLWQGKGTSQTLSSLTFPFEWEFFLLPQPTWSLQIYWQKSKKKKEFCLQQWAPWTLISDQSYRWTKNWKNWSNGKVPKAREEKLQFQVGPRGRGRDPPVVPADVKQSLGGLAWGSARGRTGGQLLFIWGEHEVKK